MDKKFMNKQENEFSYHDAALFYEDEKEQKDENKQEMSPEEDKKSKKKEKKRGFFGRKSAKKQSIQEESAAEESVEENHTKQPEEVLEETKSEEKPEEVLEETKSEEKPEEVLEEAKSEEQPEEILEEVKSEEQPEEILEEAKSEEQPQKAKKEKKRKEKKKNDPNHKQFQKKSKKKKVLIGVVALLVVLGGGAYGYYYMNGLPSFLSKNVTKIYVEKVSDIINAGSANGNSNRYAGVVESQDIWNIENNSDKAISKVYVKEGDTVKVGDKLISYDIDQAKLSLEQAQLELEKMQSEQKSNTNEIASLEKEQKSASSSEKLEYTVQINTLKAEIKKSEYDIKSKEAEIKVLKKNTKNADVKSEMNGIVKKINQSLVGTGVDDDTSSDDGDDSEVFMSILAVGDYRIKASINEQNIYTLSEDTPVTIRSRVDETQTWSGVVDKIKTDDTDDSSNSDSEENDSEYTSSTSYPFYVKLDSSTGLMLGQHVYVEMNNESTETKDGLWLDSYYIVQEDNDSYVWADNGRNRLEKRKIKVGEYNEELDKYLVEEGLEKGDLIAFPEDRLKEGMFTTIDETEASSEDDSIENGGDADVEGDFEGDYNGDFDESGDIDDLGNMEDEEIWEDEDSSNGAAETEEE